MARWLWILTLIVLGACASSAERAVDPSESRQVASPATTASAAESAASTSQPSTSSTPLATTQTVSPTQDVVVADDGPAVAFNGRPVPNAPTSAAETISYLIEIEEALRVDGRDADYYADLGHREQLVVRTLSRNPDWADQVLDGLPDDLKSILEFHLQARSELGQLHTAPPLEVLPAWRIIEPEPLDELIGYYKEAEASSGIDWQILAGINLIETGMGRIDGLSTAGAQGPMQFLPTTWAEVSKGGDIDDPHDAIQGAARYLVQRGGLDDIRAGLFGYNNSDNYVNAVLTYAELLRLDERALRGFYNWEIYVGTDVGTLWLPVGLTTDGTETAAEYFADNPWAETIPAVP